MNLEHIRRVHAVLITQLLYISAYLDIAVSLKLMHHNYTVNYDVEDYHVFLLCMFICLSARNNAANLFSFICTVNPSDRNA